MPKVKAARGNNTDPSKGITTRLRSKIKSKDESPSSPVTKRNSARTTSKSKSRQKDSGYVASGNKENFTGKTTDIVNNNEESNNHSERTVKQKRRIVIPDDDSEDSGDDFEPSKDSEDEQEYTSPFFKRAKKLKKASEKEPPKKKSKITNKSTKKNSAKGKIVNKETSFDELTPKDATRALDTKSWAHLKYEFLHPDKIKDKSQRSPSHPDYDPSTLYVPPEFLDTQTPFMHQWWLLKADHYDCVVFFRFGNFYQLFHMDGVIGANELNLTLMDIMKRGFAHTACSGASYGRMAGSLLEKGYKIARVEQTETQEMANQRIAEAQKLGKLDKLIKREVCQISSKGTKVYLPLDTEELEVSPAASVYLLSIIERRFDEISTYGVCFIDTTIGYFNLGQFQDDQCHSRLLTMIAHYPPAHIVYERGNLTACTLQLLRRHLPGVRVEAFEKGKQFWSSKKILTYLHDNGYFKSQVDDSEFFWPKGLDPYISKAGGASKPTVAKGKELAIDALAGCVHLLKDYLIDQQLLAQGLFQTYTPSDSSDKATFQMKIANNMVLDATTMYNLKVLGTEGSLLEALDYCCTPFGKRLLRSWLCRPLRRKALIVKRQKAIAELLDNHENVVRGVRGKLKQLPDLERMLSKIHAQGNETKSKNHPDGRAVIFDKEKAMKRAIMDLIVTLDGFELILDIVDSFSDFQSCLIRDCSQVEPQGEFPDLRETLEHFKNSFNREEAKKAGLIIPKRGVDSDYDAIELEFAEIRKELYEYLGTQRKLFGLPLDFVGTESKRFQIEIPDSHVHKVGMEYDLHGSRKASKRYYTPRTRELLARQLLAEKKKDKIMEDINRKIFAKFSSHFEKWSKATYSIAVIDCLISFAKYARACKTSCVPQIYNDDPSKDGIFIDIKDGQHPCIYSDNFVPNDIAIGVGDTAPLMILTGPNMGGKSTLMRQVGLLSIMAQIGCHVPASEMKLTLVDRIFTRLGASDDILGGQSTFLVELTDTSLVLQRATQNSLVLLDELGRGTSTYDGTAIAASVVEALIKMKCRTLFSTHYHSLVDDYKSNENVTLAHMACMVENDNDDEINEQSVSFLYKLKEGACPKSYGFNAARLAGVPTHITKRAFQIAKTLEAQVNLRHTFTALCRLESDSLKSLIQKTRIILSSL